MADFRTETQGPEIPSDCISIIAARAFYEVGGDRALFSKAFRAKCIDDDDAVDILNMLLQPFWPQIEERYFSLFAPKPAPDPEPDTQSDEDETERKSERRRRSRTKARSSRKRHDRRAEAHDRTFLQSNYLQLANSPPKRLDLCNGRELRSGELQYAHRSREYLHKSRFYGLLATGLTDEMICGEYHQNDEETRKLWVKAGEGL